MAIHNAAGVKMLERMGFTRAVLARELSLAEIAAIRRQTHLELEHFIHGALCYSISGQCFFSSYLTGKSGNRGRCVQPCRRRYQHHGKSGFYFSPSDLCAVEMMPQLGDAGVMSFKIEGRMKNAEYVAQVVAAYRKVIDASPERKRQAIAEAKDLLAQSYGRQWTTGFLTGRVPKDIVVPSRKGGIGQYLGPLEKTDAGAVFFTTGDIIHVGDRLRIQPESDFAGKAFTISQLCKSGFSSFRLNNMGHFHLFDNQQTVRMAAGPLLYVLNSSAALALKELGACEFSLSMEDDKKNMENVLRSGVDLSAAATVYSPIALLTSRIPMRSLGPRPVLESDREEMLRLDFSTGLTVVYAGRHFSLLGRLPELQSMGCGSFVVDLSQSGVFSGQGKDVMAAVNNNQPVAETSSFNFDRGLE